MHFREIVPPTLSHFIQLSADGKEMLHGVTLKDGYYLFGTDQYGQSLPVSLLDKKTNVLFCNIVANAPKITGR